LVLGPQKESPDKRGWVTPPLNPKKKKNRPKPHLGGKIPDSSPVYMGPREKALLPERDPPE